MAPRRLRAPGHDGGVLADPPLDQAPGLLQANRDRLAAWDYDFQGRQSGRLRAMVRSQVLAASRAYADRFGLDPAPEADPAAVETAAETSDADQADHTDDTDGGTDGPAEDDGAGQALGDHERQRS